MRHHRVEQPADLCTWVPRHAHASKHTSEARPDSHSVPQPCFPVPSPLRPPRESLRSRDPVTARRGRHHNTDPGPFPFLLHSREENDMWEAPCRHRKVAPDKGSNELRHTRQNQPREPTSLGRLLDPGRRYLGEQGGGQEAVCLGTCTSGRQKGGGGLVWAKQDLGELDPPLRRRLVGILGYESWGGGKSRWRPCRMEARVSARRPSHTHWMGDTSGCCCCWRLPELQGSMGATE